MTVKETLISALKESGFDTISHAYPVDAQRLTEFGESAFCHSTTAPE
jgi:hypothetical protein